MAEAGLAFAIIATRVHDRPFTQADGDVLLAHMTVELGPLLIVGAQLPANRAGALHVRLPGAGRTRRLVARTQSARDQLVHVAEAAYRAAGGRIPAETPVAKASPTKDSLRDPA